jgi:hypothetical protein
MSCRKCHQPYGPDTRVSNEGHRICLNCLRERGELCQHCKLRPPSRPGRPYCSKACSNSSRLVPLAERFLQYYKPGKPDACWLWLGTIHHAGYGIIGDEKQRQRTAHRLSYELKYGAVPEGKNVLHKCDNPPCVNPAHLFLGTVQDNNEDKRLKGRHGFGETHPRAKLTTADVRTIRARYANEGGGNELAATYGVTRDTIYDIVYRRRWTHIG